MCTKRQIALVRNVQARIVRRSDDSVYLVTGVRFDNQGIMREDKGAPKPKKFRSIEYCTGCGKVRAYKPEVAA